MQNYGTAYGLLVGLGIILIVIAVSFLCLLGLGALKQDAAQIIMEVIQLGGIA